MSKKMRISALAVLIGWTVLTAGLAKADDPIPPPQYRTCTVYFHDSEMTQWAGYECKECNGEITGWGVATQYYSFGQNPCGP